jgi:colicin import membrane protein
MFRSRIAKLAVAGSAAAAGLILLVSSAGAHQAQLFAREGLTLSTSTASSAREGENDAAADAAAVAAEAQKEAAAKAAEAAKEKAAAAAEQATEAQDETGDVETETGDNETDETGTEDTTTLAAGTHDDSGDNKGESHSGD